MQGHTQTHTHTNKQTHTHTHTHTDTHTHTHQYFMYAYKAIFKHYSVFLSGLHADGFRALGADRVATRLNVMLSCGGSNTDPTQR